MVESVHPAACWLNGRLVAPQEAMVSVFDHGLLYGDGVFEGIRFYNWRSCRREAHLERPALSARAIALTFPDTLAELTDAVEQPASAAGAADGYLRLGVTRGVGPLGL